MRTSPASSLLPPINVKRNTLSKRLAELTEEYELIYRQIATKLNDVDGLRLEREADAIYEKMLKVDRQIKQLDETEQNPLQEHLELHKKLARLDFREVNQIIDSILARFGREGGAALFLLQQSYSMAGELCIAGIRDRLIEDCNIFKHCPIDLAGRQGAITEQELLNAIAGYFQPIDQMPDLSQYAQAIVQKIRLSLESGSIILFELRRWDELDAQGRLLAWFIDRFWVPLSQELPNISQQYRRVRFIAIISSESTLSDECLNLPYYCDGNRVEGHKILELPLRNWTEEDLSDWLDRYSGLQASEIDRLAKRIYKASRSGIPQLAWGKLQEELEDYTQR
jgi:hypothetical protein